MSTRDFLPFLTGSRAYGTPRDDSDIDIVIRTDDKALVEALTKANEMDVRPNPFYFPTRVGPLNIMVCTTDNAYRAWREGTETIKQFAKENGPASREMAIKVLSDCRHRYGVEPDEEYVLY